MICKHLDGVLLAGVLIVNPISHLLAHPMGSARSNEADVITVQGWPSQWDQARREHCWQLRNRAQEVRDRIYYAPPWERERMEHYLWGVQERLRGECRGSRMGLGAPGAPGHGFWMGIGASPPRQTYLLMTEPNRVNANAVGAAAANPVPLGIG
jgi:hypothetical protein